MICERSRKQSYTYQDAAMHARFIRQRYESLVGPYRCPICRMWHVGSHEKRH